VTQESFQRVINVLKRFAKTNDALLAEGRDGGEVRLGINDKCFYLSKNKIKN
jgi:hypothetical protein